MLIIFLTTGDVCDRAGRFHAEVPQVGHAPSRWAPSQEGSSKRSAPQPAAQRHQHPLPAHRRVAAGDSPHRPRHRRRLRGQPPRRHGDRVHDDVVRGEEEEAAQVPGDGRGAQQRHGYDVTRAGEGVQGLQGG